MLEKYEPALIEAAARLKLLAGEEFFASTPSLPAASTTPP